MSPGAIKSFRRKPESSGIPKSEWIPAFAGMTSFRVDAHLPEPIEELRDEMSLLPEGMT